jgi:hypothetical protein
VPAPDDVVQAADRLRGVLGAHPGEGVKDAVAELGHYARVRAALSRLASAAAQANVVGPDVDVIGAALAGASSTGVQYANPWHPNAIQSLWNGDIDATIELVGHVRAENPGSDVRWLLDDQVNLDGLTGHIIILGGGDYLFGQKQDHPLGYLRDRLELPLETEISGGGDLEYDAHFVVLTDDDGTPAQKGSRREIYAPRFITDAAGVVKDHGQPLLEYDVAFLLRAPNPLNLSGTLTVCTGIFSRGTYGAVRALTDASLRARNERYLSSHLDMSNFWMLMHVPVFPGLAGAQTITPDLARPFHRLRMSH